MNLSYIEIPTHYLESLAPLSDSEKGRLFTALLEYASTGEAPQLPGNERFVFPMMRGDVDEQRFDADDAHQNSSQQEREREERKERSKEKKEEKEKELSIKFDRFWQAYPRKVCKKAAFEKFRAAMKKDVTLEQMLEALEEHKGSEQWQDPQYIPHPSTWLNQERWDDELTPLPNQNQEEPPPPPRVEERFIDGEWVTVEVKE